MNRSLWRPSAKKKQDSLLADFSKYIDFKSDKNFKSLWEWSVKNPEKFWSGLNEAAHDLAIKNRELLKKRENLQKKIDDWHIKNRENQIQTEVYKKFLKEIAYLVDEGEDFNIETDNVDDEITKLLGHNW